MKINMKFNWTILSFLTKKSTPTRPLIVPAREWGTSLLVTIMIAILLFGLAGFDFYEQLTDRAMPEVSEEHIPKYRASDAEFLIRYHEGRQEMFEKLRADKPYIPPVTAETEGEVEGSVAGNSIAE
jgi:hypothetical protein